MVRDQPGGVDLQQNTGWEQGYLPGGFNCFKADICTLVGEAGSYIEQRWGCSSAGQSFQRSDFYLRVFIV